MSNERTDTWRHGCSPSRLPLGEQTTVTSVGSGARQPDCQAKIHQHRVGINSRRRLSTSPECQPSERRW